MESPFNSSPARREARNIAQLCRVGSLWAFTPWFLRRNEILIPIVVSAD